jgi:hypothetical protein
MATLTISLSDEELRRLEALDKREGLTVEQMARLGINDFIDQPDDAFRAAAKRVMGKTLNSIGACYSPNSLACRISPRGCTTHLPNWRKSSSKANAVPMPSRFMSAKLVQSVKLNRLSGY